MIGRTLVVGSVGVTTGALMVTLIAGCTGAGSGGAPPTHPAGGSSAAGPPRSSGVAVTVSGCRRPPPAIRRWVARHGEADQWSLASVQLQPADSLRRVDLVGIYIGKPRIALLAREHSAEPSTFVALNRFSHRITDRPEDQTLTNLADDHVIVRLRECFAS